METSEQRTSRQSPSEGLGDQQPVLTQLISWLQLEEQGGSLIDRNNAIPTSFKDPNNIDNLCKTCASVPWSEIMDTMRAEREPTLERASG